MYISPWPGITPGDLLGTGAPRELPYPLNAPHRHSFCVARSGIYHLFRALNLKPSDAVLAPDYHSGNEVSAMVAAGAAITYYPIRANFEPDLDALTRLARRVKPRVVYAIHYLGWPQPMREIEAIAREYGAIVIEDCALAMLSESNGLPLGATGDYSIFCAYKTLPIPNGGLLIENRAPLAALAQLDLEPCPPMTAVGRMGELASEAVRSRHDRTGALLFAMKQAAGRALRSRGVRHVPVGDIGWNEADVRVAMSQVSERVMARLDYERIRSTRRANFLHLRESLQGVALVRTDLGEGTCPLFFPILVRDKAAAAKALHARGISAVEFWNDVHPHAAPHCGEDCLFLHKHVLELPIHQDVTAAQVDYIAREVSALKLAWEPRHEFAVC